MARVLLVDLLAEEEAPTDFSILVTTKWEVEGDTSLDSTVRRSRTGYDLDVGAVEETGLEIYRFISHLAREGGVGVEKLILLVISIA